MAVSVGAGREVLVGKGAAVGVAGTDEVVEHASALKANMKPAINMWGGWLLDMLLSF
jgi:hypothetical protein